MITIIFLRNKIYEKSSEIFCIMESRRLKTMRTSFCKIIYAVRSSRCRVPRALQKVLRLEPNLGRSQKAGNQLSWASKGGAKG
jgi:hypothetical protein